ncbi:MAG: MerR family transcriptional regulator [Pseudomonadota bacterium]
MPAPKSKPEKSAEAYRSIGEVAKELGLPTHVLRYWETKFPRHVRPVKRPDGRRLYRKSDIDGLRAIQTLVHRRGMTLKGAKALLQERGVQIMLGGEGDLASILAGSPVHELQRSLRTAYGRTTGEEREAVQTIDVPDGDTGSPERLQAMLDGMGELKMRLDAALARRAA